MKNPVRYPFEKLLKIYREHWKIEERLWRVEKVAIQKQSHIKKSFPIGYPTGIMEDISCV